MGVGGGVAAAAVEEPDEEGGETYEEDACDHSACDSLGIAAGGGVGRARG